MKFNKLKTLKSRRDAAQERTARKSRLILHEKVGSVPKDSGTSKSLGGSTTFIPLKAIPGVSQESSGAKHQSENRLWVVQANYRDRLQSNILSPARVPLNEGWNLDTIPPIRVTCFGKKEQMNKTISLQYKFKRVHLLNSKDKGTKYNNQTEFTYNGARHKPDAKAAGFYKKVPKISSRSYAVDDIFELNHWNVFDT